MGTNVNASRWAPLTAARELAWPRHPPHPRRPRSLLHMGHRGRGGGACRRACHVARQRLRSVQRQRASLSLALVHKKHTALRCTARSEIPGSRGRAEVRARGIDLSTPSLELPPSPPAAQLDAHYRYEYLQHYLVLYIQGSVQIRFPHRRRSISDSAPQ